MKEKRNEGIVAKLANLLGKLKEAPPVKPEDADTVPRTMYRSLPKVISLLPNFDNILLWEFGL